MIIGSIAPAYRPDKRIRGHVVSFQSSLQGAARSRGANFKILVPKDIGSSGQDDVIPCLPDRRDPTRVLSGVDEWLRSLDGDEAVVVMLYEGALRWLAAFDALAADHPDVKFLVNLFAPEAGLDAPSSSEDGLIRPMPARVRELAHRAAGPLALRPDPQANVVVLAETEQRRFLAEALGIRTGRAWPLHSQIATIELPSRTVTAGSSVRVLVPIAPRQVSPRVLREIDFVTRQTDRASDDRPIEWTLACPLGDDRATSKRVHKVLRPGMSLVAEALESLAYASLFAAHDAVWFPFRGQYNTQSSGKALDALVTATPIIAPAGSYAARQQQRWLPGAPAYDGSREAIELLLRLHALAPAWQRDLRDVQSEIRSSYSADTALSTLIEVAARTSTTTHAVEPPRLAGTRAADSDRPLSRWRKHHLRLTELLDLARAFLRFLRR